MGKRVNGDLCFCGSYSPNNLELGALTLQNHWEYCVRHGYDFLAWMEPYDSAMYGLLPAWKDLLKVYKRIFMMGSDIIITNPDIPLSTFFDDSVGAVVSIESINTNPGSGSPINNDTTLVNNNPKGFEYIDYLIGLEGVWSHPYKHQGATVRLMEERPGIVVAKPIQSFPYVDSPHKWKEGDFCIHFVCGGVDSKTVRVREFLEKGIVAWRNCIR